MSRAGSWRRIRAVAWRQLLVLRGSPHRLFDVTIWPLVDTLLFGSLATFFAQTGGAPGQQAAGYVMAGILLWHVVYQAQIALATGFLEETWSRNLLNLLVTPLREVEFVAGVALLGLVKLVAGVGVVAVVAFACYAFSASSLGWSLLPIVAVLLAAGWVVGLFVIALVLRFGSGAEALAWGIFFVVMPLSGVFYPVDALPAFLRPVALVLPTTHAFAASREVLDGHGMPWGELGAAALAVLGAAVVSLWFLRRMLATFRRRGFVTRYT